MVLLRIYKQGLNGTIVNRQVKRVGGGCCSESNKWLIIMINGEYCIELNNWFKGTIVHETRFKLRIDK